MSAVIQIDDRGLATVEIANHDGEVLSYAVAPAPEGLDDWACRVSLVGEPGRSYRASVVGLGWACTCKDWEHRTRRSRKGGANALCKHLAAAQAVRAFLRLFEGVPAS